MVTLLVNIMAEQTTGIIYDTEHDANEAISEATIMVKNSCFGGYNCYVRKIAHGSNNTPKWMIYFHY